MSFYFYLYGWEVKLGAKQAQGSAKLSKSFVNIELMGNKIFCWSKVQKGFLSQTNSHTLYLSVLIIHLHELFLLRPLWCDVFMSLLGKQELSYGHIRSEKRQPCIVQGNEKSTCCEIIHVNIQMSLMILACCRLS